MRIRHSFSIGFLAALALYGAFAEEPRKLPPKAQQILDLANAAPPEFHAWAILKILQDQDLVKDRSSQRQLIEEAYDLASAARTRYSVQALGSTPHDSRSAILSLAGTAGLDGLTLQVHAVQFMLPIDKQKARQMFTDIPKPSVPALTCDDDVIPRLDDYYQLIGRIAQETFTPKERQREDHVNFVIDNIGAIGSPAQLVPAATMLRVIGVTPEEKQLLYAKFGSALENVQPDDRSFADITSALTPLLTPDVMPAFQRFITNHASAEKCHHAQNQPSTPGAFAVQGNPAATGTLAGEMLWQSADSKNIRQMSMHLHIRDGRVVSAADRADAAWQLEFQNFLGAIADWKPAEGESEAVFFHEKASAYLDAADLAASAESRDYVLDEAARFIATSALENTSPAEWFFRATRTDEAGHLTTDLLRAWERSGNPALVLYVALRELVGPNVVH